MKISAINSSIPVYKKQNNSDIKKSSNPISQFDSIPRSSVDSRSMSKYPIFQDNKQYRPNFGMDPFTLAMIGYGLFYSAVVGGVAIKSNFDEIKTKLAQKEVEEERQKKLNEISNTYGVSINDAQVYHDEFLQRASIPINGNGNEIGLNAVMGYEIEKYKLAMDIIAPTVIAQRGQYSTRPKPPSGILLYGPPGGGKTYIADKLCEHLEYFNVKTEKLEFDPDDHKGNVAKIADAFNAAKENYKENKTYTLIRLPDDIDNYMIDRNLEDSEFKAETAALIRYAENCSSRGTIWMSTANNPKRIDKAILRPGRTDVKLPIGNMKDYTTADMIKYSLYKYGESEAANDFDYKKVLDTMQEMEYVHTPYEIEYLVSQAKNHNMEPGKHVDADMFIAEMVNYNEKDFPTLDEATIAKFLEDQEYLKESGKI